MLMRSAQIAAVPVTAVILVVGIWITGGLLTSDFALSMLLTVVWLAAAGLTALAISSRRRELRWPVLGTYVAVAVAVGVWAFSTTFIGNTVDEDVAVAGQGNVELAAGSFESVAHSTTGRAAVVRLASGGSVLTLTDFETDPGPDVRVLLVPGEVAGDGDVEDAIDLGGIKGNKGDQQYELPDGVDVRRQATVVLWCRPFTVRFGQARLRPS